jgi:large subunit ribosomal protein L21
VLARTLRLRGARPLSSDRVVVVPWQASQLDAQQDAVSRRCRPEESEPAVYAVVRAGSKQQKVAVGDVIEIDKIETGVGESLTLPVVMIVDGEKVTASGLDKAGVTVEVLGATKGPKIVIQKYKNKTGYKKRQGHRQKYTQVKVTDITV